MATKSILKEVQIKDKASARKLVSALENAGNAKSKRVTVSRTVSTATKEDIRRMFGVSE